MFDSVSLVSLLVMIPTWQQLLDPSAQLVLVIGPFEVSASGVRLLWPACITTLDGLKLRRRIVVVSFVGVVVVFLFVLLLLLLVLGVVLFVGVVVVLRSVVLGVGVARVSVGVASVVVTSVVTSSWGTLSLPLD